MKDNLDTISNAAKSFDIAVTSLIVLHNFFYGLTENYFQIYLGLNF